MKAELNYEQNNSEHKAIIDLDELGILINGMNERYLREYSTAAKSALTKSQNELITYAAEKELPITLINYPIYGRMSGPLEKALSHSRIYETITSNNNQNADKETYSFLNEHLKRNEISNIIMTGTDMFLMELLKSLHINEVITTRSIISILPSNAKSYMPWIKNNTILIPDDQLNDLIYSKP